MSILTAKSQFEPRQLIRLTLSNRNLVTTLILVVALVGFELFNYSTTFVALHDLLGDLTFLQLKWATILAIAFCAIDFAGISRLFMPEEDHNLSRDTWFLFAAWLMAATMNAILTWWGVSMSIASHSTQSAAIIDAKTLTNIVPVFVAIMVWVTRILLIGSFSFSGQRLFSQVDPINGSIARSSNPKRFVTSKRQAQTIGYTPQPSRPATAQRTNRPATLTPRPRSAQSASPSRPQPAAARPEPEYVSDPAFRSLTAQRNSQEQTTRRF